MSSFGAISVRLLVDFPVDFFVADLREDFFAVDFRALDFLAVDFRAVDFFALVFFAAIFSSLVARVATQEQRPCQVFRNVIAETMDSSIEVQTPPAFRIPQINPISVSRRTSNLS